MLSVQRPNVKHSVICTRKEEEEKQRNQRIIINRGIYNGSSSLRVKDNLSSSTFVVIDLDSLDGHLNEQLDPLYFGKQK